MEAPTPDFGIVEHTWESHLREGGLTPSRVGSGVATGYNRLELYRQETQVAEINLTQPPEHSFIGSVEVKIVLELPAFGDFVMHDLITQRGPSLDGALEACANTFMAVTFPPLEALFTGRRPEGLGTGTLTITSFTVDQDQAVNWDVVVGPLQVLNNSENQVRERLQSKPPFTLIMDTLIGHLSVPRLHWCKLYGVNISATRLDFRCSIDDQQSAQGEAEMADKFGAALPGQWEFRQFLVVRPMGDADPVTTADLRARAAEAFSQQEKNGL